MDVEAEIIELKRRIAVLENEVEADRELPVRLFRYVREMRDDIALLRQHAVAAGKHVETIETRLDRVEQRLDKVEQRLSKVESELTGLRAEFNAFRKELPGMIAEAMREVLREYRSR
jgi:chromosome segregation ATPase